MNNYEALVIEIQKEARKFQSENEQLKENLGAIITENNRLKQQENDDPLGIFRSNYIEVADQIFNNLRNQLLLSHKVIFF